MSEYEINQKVAEVICDTLCLNGQEFRLGECVALLDGMVIAVTQDLEGAVNAVRALTADLQRGMVFQVSPQIDYVRGPYLTSLDHG